LLHVTPEAVTPQARGFFADDPMIVRRLSTIGTVFIGGFNRSLETIDVEAIAGWCDLMPNELRGFAFEGASFGLAMRDAFRWNSSPAWDRFLRGPAAAHTYMAHVGAGWALARVPRSIAPFLKRFDETLRWLVVDGLGFHEGFFRTRSVLKGHRPWRVPQGYACRAFDHGVGRSLWFVLGADPSRIAKVIDQFAPGRRADLWSGIGLAATYAGGVPGLTLNRLRDAGNQYAPMLAQGAAFAAQARRLAGNVSEHTETACQRLCGTSAERAAEISDLAQASTSTMSINPRYEAWRSAIQYRFTETTRGVT
jgi:hypothetical protein